MQSILGNHDTKIKNLLVMYVSIHKKLSRKYRIYSSTEHQKYMHRYYIRNEFVKIFKNIDHNEILSEWFLCREGIENENDFKDVFNYAYDLFTDLNQATFNLLSKSKDVGRFSLHSFKNIIIERLGEYIDIVLSDQEGDRNFNINILKKIQEIKLSRIFFIDDDLAKFLNEIPSEIHEITSNTNILYQLNNIKTDLSFSIHNFEFLVNANDITIFLVGSIEFADDLSQNEVANIVSICIHNPAILDEINIIHEDLLIKIWEININFVLKNWKCFTKIPIDIRKKIYSTKNIEMPFDEFTCLISEISPKVSKVPEKLFSSFGKNTTFNMLIVAEELDRGKKFNFIEKFGIKSKNSISIIKELIVKCSQDILSEEFDKNNYLNYPTNADLESNFLIDILSRTIRQDVSEFSNNKIDLTTKKIIKYKERGNKISYVDWPTINYSCNTRSHPKKSVYSEDFIKKYTVACATIASSLEWVTKTDTRSRKFTKNSFAELRHQIRNNSSLFTNEESREVLNALLDVSNLKTLEQNFLNILVSEYYNKMVVGKLDNDLYIIFLNFILSIYFREEPLYKIDTSNYLSNLNSGEIHKVIDFFENYVCKKFLLRMGFINEQCLPKIVHIFHVNLFKDEVYKIKITSTMTRPPLLRIFPSYS